MLFADGSTMIWLSLYFRFISKNWLYFQIYGICACALCSFLCLAIPESPKYLYGVKQYKGAKLSLKTIAKFNKAVFSTKFKFDLEEEEKLRAQRRNENQNISQ